MPKKSTLATETLASENKQVVIDHDSKSPPITHDMSMEQKMDMVIAYLHRMDRRDHWRTIGGFFRGVLTLLPILIFLLSAWYFYMHGTEFLQELTDMSIKSMTNQESLMDRLNGYMGQPTN